VEIRILVQMLQVDNSTGEVVKWSVGGRSLLAHPLGPLLMRAPTDNDRGGSGGTSYLDRSFTLLLLLPNS